MLSYYQKFDQKNFLKKIKSIKKKDSKFNTLEIECVLDVLENSKKKRYRLCQKN